MRLAAVDIGSNTVHSLVADVVRGKLEDVAHYVEEPELGPYVARTGAIGSRSKVAILALRSVVERARSHGFEVLIATGTLSYARPAARSESPCTSSRLNVRPS
jgi:exopolyphosphatase/pppGpp-phosphohydrolase